MDKRSSTHGEGFWEDNLASQPFPIKIQTRFRTGFGACCRHQHPRAANQLFLECPPSALFDPHGAFAPPRHFPGDSSTRGPRVRWVKSGVCCPGRCSRKRTAASQQRVLPSSTASSSKARSSPATSKAVKRKLNFSDGPASSSRPFGACAARALQRQAESAATTTKVQQQRRDSEAGGQKVAGQRQWDKLKAAGGWLVATEFDEAFSPP